MQRTCNSNDLRFDFNLLNYQIYLFALFVASTTCFHVTRVKSLFALSCSSRSFACSSSVLAFTQSAYQCSPLNHEFLYLLLIFFHKSLSLCIKLELDLSSPLLTSALFIYLLPTCSFSSQALFNSPKANHYNLTVLHLFSQFVADLSAKFTFSRIGKQICNLLIFVFCHQRLSKVFGFFLMEMRSHKKQTKYLFIIDTFNSSFFLFLISIVKSFNFIIKI